MGKKFFGFSTDSEWDYENGFYLTSPLTRLGKALAQYELYKMVIDLPGQVVECGVYKGASLIRFATFREILESPFSRKIIGFDAFGQFPVHAHDNDEKFIKLFENVGGDGIPADELNKVLAHKGLRNVELVPGDVIQTIPQYLQEHPELKIALLHIDVDIYKPTLSVLENLWNRVVKKGIIVLDDYATVDGATVAIDEFLANKNVCIRKSPATHIPPYVRKE